VTNIRDIDTGMPTVIDIKTGQPVVTIQHRRIAEKIGDLIKADSEEICLCRWRERFGKNICKGCPSNPNNTIPDGAA
jgi:hypothetical protein